MIYEPVTVVMTTCFFDEQRAKIAYQTLASWAENLRYTSTIYLHVADDGGDILPDIEKMGRIINKTPNSCMSRKITYSEQKAQGVGASLNAGFKQAFELSPYVLYLVDDWRLDQPFDITPWVYLLQQREDVGIVRLGPPHPHLYGKIEPMTELWQGWALRLERHGLVVGHRPEIFHKRMIDYYGWFDEQVNAQECERLYSVRWAADDQGPDIVLALPHPWFHIDQADLPSTSHIDPKDRQ